MLSKQQAERIRGLVTVVVARRVEAAEAARDWNVAAAMLPPENPGIPGRDQLVEKLRQNWVAAQAASERAWQALDKALGLMTEGEAVAALREAEDSRLRATWDASAKTAGIMPRRPGDRARPAVDRTGGGVMDLLMRWVPGHHWVRLFLSFSRDFEPGHSWMYAGVLRRDAWRIGRVGFGIMRLPRKDVAS